MVDTQLSKVPDWNVSRTCYFPKSLNQRTRTKHTIFWAHTRYRSLSDLWMKWGKFNVYFLGYGFLAFRIKIYQCCKSYKKAVSRYNFSQVNISPPAKRQGPNPRQFSSSSSITGTSGLAINRLHGKECSIHHSDSTATRNTVSFIAKLANWPSSPCNLSLQSEQTLYNIRLK